MWTAEIVTYWHSTFMLSSDPWMSCLYCLWALCEHSYGAFCVATYWRTLVGPPWLCFNGCFTTLPPTVSPVWPVGSTHTSVSSCLWDITLVCLFVSFLSPIPRTSGQLFIISLLDDNTQVLWVVIHLFLESKKLAEFKLCSDFAALLKNQKIEFIGREGQSWET